MVTPTQRRALTKEGYKIIGTHSAVKLCRWTKAQLRGRGGRHARLLAAAARLARGPAAAVMGWPRMRAHYKAFFFIFERLFDTRISVMMVMMSRA